MGVRLSNICIDAVDPRLVAGFWAAVLGWEVAEEDESGVCLSAPDGDQPDLDILVVAEGKQVKNRVHIDVRADHSTFEAEVDRLEGLGARRVDIGQGPDVTWIVYADPEGNEFCLLRQTVQELAAGSA